MKRSTLLIACLMCMVAIVAFAGQGTSALHEDANGNITVRPADLNAASQAKPHYTAKQLTHSGDSPLDIIEVLPTTLSTSGNGRAPQGGRLYIATKYIITGLEMTNAGFAGAVSSIGWEWNNPGGAVADQGVETTGDLQVYMKDTTEAALALQSSYVDTAGQGYTKIIDATITIPAGTAQIDIDVPTGGPGTGVYTHIAGHGVIVLFRYHTTTTLGTLGAPTVDCNTSVGGNVLYTYQSQSAAGNVGTTSTFRPATRFGGPTPLVDAIALPAIYALGKIPKDYGMPQIISVPVKNVSATLSGSVDVTLTVKRASDGLVRYTNTQSGVAMAVNDTNIVVFPSFSSPAVEDDSIIVQTTSIAGETNLGNNRAAMLQHVTTNRFAYSQGTTPSGGVGFNTASGDFVARFTTGGNTAVIDSIQVNFSTGGQPYQVGIWDDDGPGGTPGTLMYQSASGTAPSGVVTLAINPAVVVVGEYFIGVKQTGTTNVSFSYQAENPIRPNCFYFTSPTGGTSWTDFSPNNGFRFMIEANIAQGSPMAYASSTTTQNTTPVLPGAVNQQVIEMQVVTTGNLLPVSATSFTLNTAGTTNPATDISNAKIFFTGTSATFSPINQFGVTVASPSGPVIVSGTQALQSGTNHFWLTYDINPGATVTNVVDAQFNSVTVAAVPQTPTDQNPVGSRQIKTALAAGDYTVGALLFGRITGRSFYTETRTRKVMREVPVADATAVAKKGVTSDVNNVAPTHTEFREVEEEYNVLMENGRPVTGRLYAPLTKQLRAEYGLTDNMVGVYPTITAAIADLNALGVTGPISFTLLDPTYPSETYPLQINQVTGGSATNTVKIRPATSSTIAGSSASAIFKLNGADYITIDGSNSGGTDRSLTITNSNAGTNSAVIWLASIASPKDSATNNTIKNCIISGGTPDASTRYCILSSGSSAGGVADAQNINNTYRNNATSKAVFGIAVVGPTANESGLLVTQNTIGVTDTIGLNGVAAFQQKNAVISNNTIDKVVTATTGTASGIRIAGTADSVLITSNKISDIRNNNPAGWGSNGVQLNASVTGTKVTVANNFIWDVRAAGFADGTVLDNGYGIIAVTGGGYRVYHNSVNMNTNQDTLSGRPAAMNIAPAIPSGGIDIRNNIFSNSMTFGTNRYAIYSSARDTSFSAINYNDYYTTGPNLGFFNTTNRADLAAWQAATLQDANSKSGNPLFQSATNLHVTSACSPAGNAGTPIASVTNDIDGDLRSGSTPDIGADEFVPVGVCSGVNVLASWNLVSLPVSSPTGGNLVQQVYANSATATAFYFNGSYQTTTTLNPGPGYWIKSTTAYTQNIGGSNIDSLTVPVSVSPSPWNIIGSITSTIDTSSARVTPSVAGLRGSAFFKYAAGYQATATIEPGGGYWVKANAVGTFHLHNTSAPVAPAKGSTATRSIDDLNVLTIQDANGGVQKLYFGTDASNQIPVNMFAMPPAPPAGLFDARFAIDGGMMVQTHAEEVSDVIEMPISIQSIAYPLTVSWNVHGSSATYELSDATGSHAIRGEGSLKINNSAVNHLTLKVTAGSTLPKEFALSQNYPNPFNPTTNIKYALPVDSRVTMEIFNVLGQRVATLVNDVREAGYHVAEWNGTSSTGVSVGSGVYFVRMSAEGGSKKFSEVRKLMMLK